MSKEFAAAFLAAQREFPSIGKGRTADMGNYSYKYADLSDVLDAALPVLHKHGIALSQAPVSEDGKVGVETRLIHESGHIEHCGALLLPSGNNAQAAGSAMTYARRYAACAALGIVADEDDDGRAAVVSEPIVTDGASWLATASEMFGLWTLEQRRETAAQVAKELGAKKPLSMEEAKAIHTRMSERYYAEQELNPDEAPF